MRFMVIVKASQASEAGEMPSREMLEAMGRFNEELVASGIMLAGDGLQASSKGARIFFEDGKTTVVDGPFAEIKEVIAGFWIVKADSKAQVVEIFRRCPPPHDEPTHIEIRQLFDAEDFSDEIFPPEAKARENELRRQLGQA